MAQDLYKGLKVIVADDFSNFRASVSRMMADLGVSHIDTASNADEVILSCEKTPYDLVLCDYNLGTGRNGQHVLEELHHRSILSRSSIFVLVSAEASRNIVMSAYDSSPDDYLMKPITGRMLNNRLDRLLSLRKVIQPVYELLERDDKYSAMDILIDMSLAEDRYSTSAQKLLGELFLDAGEYNKAEKLYMTVLEVRELDWARLGLAKAKYLQGDYEHAGRWLEKIISDNYLYLPAYDVLSENHVAQGSVVEAQAVVQQSVDVSPMSILRQKSLAELAAVNRDYKTEIEAMRRVVKLGKLSCYGEISDNVGFLRSVVKGIENAVELPVSLVNEAMEGIESVTESEDADFVVHAQLNYLQSRMHASKKEKDQANRLLVEAESILQVEDSNIDVEVDHVRALLALNYEVKAKTLLSRLQELYADDQSALEKLDEFLDEPVSEANKAMVAQVNREGIELYNEGKYEAALLCFEKATNLFPKHLGLRLNIIQAMVGKIRSSVSENTYELVQECRECLSSVAYEIDDDNPQYKRFIQLKNMVMSLSEPA